PLLFAPRCKGKEFARWNCLAVAALLVLGFRIVGQAWVRNLRFAVTARNRHVRHVRSLPQAAEIRLSVEFRSRTFRRFGGWLRKSGQRSYKQRCHRQTKSHIQSPHRDGSQRDLFFNLCRSYWAPPERRPGPPSSADPANTLRPSGSFTERELQV